jgi:hypothetical protein
MNDMIVCDTPEKINAFRLLALRSMLKLECVGMKRSRGPSAYAMVKKQYGFKGNKAAVLTQFTARLVLDGILVTKAETVEFTENVGGKPKTTTIPFYNV